LEISKALDKTNQNMKKVIENSFRSFGGVASLLFITTAQLHAQDNLYLSNLGDTSGNGTIPVSDEASDVNWLSAGFVTGTNPGGYILDSVQVLMDNSQLGPGHFNISIYTNGGDQPGASLVALSGSPSPYIAGTYAYTSSDIALSPSTSYWIVINPFLMSDGWDFTVSADSSSIDGWSNTGISYASSDQGSSWDDLSGEFLQFSVNADPVPEPSVVVLLTIGLITATSKTKFKRL
jgi:hypothetical protein